MKSIKILMAVFLLLSSVTLQAEIKNVSTENVKISGSCALCKEGIETAAFEKNVSKASWDKDTKMALVTFDSKKTSLGAVLRKVALAGYDNDSYLARTMPMPNLRSAASMSVLLRKPWQRKKCLSISMALWHLHRKKLPPVQTR